MFYRQNNHVPALRVHASPIVVIRLACVIVPILHVIKSLVIDLASDRRLPVYRLEAGLS